ncbi:MAG: hypothetical protein R3B39_01250 [Candidatus Paceibacterota bacterium]
MKGIVSKEREILITMEMMRGAEDRVERLRRISKKVKQLSKIISRTWRNRRNFRSSNGIDERKKFQMKETIENQGYDFNLN